jgi:alkylhydroperoxidase family enzyme
VYEEKERIVLEYAETASATPAEVSEHLMNRLHEHFSDEQIVELAAWVALENYRSRFNAGLGLHSQGFSDNCRVPAVARQAKE